MLSDLPAPPCRRKQAQAMCKNEKNVLDSAAPKKHPVERVISRDGNHTQCLRRWSSSAGFKLFVFAGVVSIQHWN